jgi:hypothetical protein
VPILVTVAKASNFTMMVRNTHLTILNLGLFCGIHWCYVRLTHSIGEVYWPDANSLPYVR